MSDSGPLYCPKCDHELVPGTLYCPVDHAISGGVRGVTKYAIEHTPRSKRHLLGITVADSYIITGFLGAGGFGAVYRAEQKALGREVALKLLVLEGLSDETIVGRFKREARTAAQLLDPNIVTLFDYGEAVLGRSESDRVLYMAMELVQGPTLRQVIKKTKGPGIDASLQIGINVLSGLAAAHQQGVVHRDLKPPNILIDESKSRPWHARLFDFGIASLQSAGGHQTQLTQGGVLGTPKYMAPEQWRAQPTAPCTDVYAFGVIVAEMLAGKPPIPKMELADMARAHCRKPRPELGITSRNEPVPLALTSFIKKCMAIDPRQRYGTANEALHSLRAIDRDRDRAQIPELLSVGAGGDVGESDSGGGSILLDDSLGNSPQSMAPSAGGVVTTGQGQIVGYGRQQPQLTPPSGALIPPPPNVLVADQSVVSGVHPGMQTGQQLPPGSVHQTGPVVAQGMINPSGQHVAPGPVHSMVSGVQQQAYTTMPPGTVLTGQLQATNTAQMRAANGGGTKWLLVGFLLAVILGGGAFLLMGGMGVRRGEPEPEGVARRTVAGAAAAGALPAHVETEPAPAPAEVAEAPPAAGAESDRGLHRGEGEPAVEDPPTGDSKPEVTPTEEPATEPSQPSVAGGVAREEPKIAGAQGGEVARRRPREARTPKSPRAARAPARQPAGTAATTPASEAGTSDSNQDEKVDNQAAESNYLRGLDAQRRGAPKAARRFLAKALRQGLTGSKAADAQKRMKRLDDDLEWERKDDW